MGSQSHHRPGLFQVLLTAVVFCTVAVWGCAPQKSPDLLTVHSVGPSTLEEGSELRVVGEGFPENRPGQVALLGTVYTPARAPRKVSWVFPIVADTRTSISHRLGEKELREHLRDAHHVTFVGTAEVHFSPLFKGRPALSGTSQTFELDLFSTSAPLKKVTLPDSAEDPKRFEDYLGLELGPDLSIQEAGEDSIAYRAGLRKGDLVRTLDSVHLDSRFDFLPQAQANISTIEFSRPGFKNAATVHVPRADFQVLDGAVATRALAIFVGIVGALCVIARPPRFLIWLFISKSNLILRRERFLVDLKRRGQLWAYPTFLGVVLVYYVLLSIRPPALYNLDFLACLTLGTLLMQSGAFCLGGARHSSKGFSLVGALSAAWTQLLALIPLLLCCTFRASELGTLRLVEIAESQGAWPHEWGALSSPWTFLLATSALLSLVPVAGRRAPIEGHIGTAGAAGASGRILEWSGQLVFIGLWIALFLGAPPREESALVAALFLSGKFTVVVRLLHEIRTRTGQIRLGEAGPLSVRLSYGLALGAIVLGFTQFLVQGALVPHEWQKAFSLSACIAFAALLVVSSQRSWTHTGRRSDPWI